MKSLNEQTKEKKVGEKTKPQIDLATGYTISQVPSNASQAHALRHMCLYIIA